MDFKRHRIQFHIRYTTLSSSLEACFKRASSAHAACHGAGPDFQVHSSLSYTFPVLLYSPAIHLGCCLVEELAMLGSTSVRLLGRLTKDMSHHFSSPTKQSVGCPSSSRSLRYTYYTPRTCSSPVENAPDPPRTANRAVLTARASTSQAPHAVRKHIRLFLRGLPRD